MEKSQFELLLSQLYKCSLALNEAILKDDLVEIEKLMKSKSEKIRLIDANKKFLTSSFSLFDVLVNEIKKQENKNLELMKEKRNAFYSAYRQSIKRAKIFNKYAPAILEKGAIIDEQE